MNRNFIKNEKENVRKIECRSLKIQVGITEKSVDRVSFMYNLRMLVI